MKGWVGVLDRIFCVAAADLLSSSMRLCYVQVANLMCQIMLLLLKWPTSLVRNSIILQFDRLCCSEHTQSLYCSEHTQSLCCSEHKQSLCCSEHTQ